MTDLQMLLSFFGIFIGVLLRTILPSLKKLQSGQAWDHTYTATAGFAVLTSLITAVMAFSSFNLPEGISGYFMVGVVSFVYGWGLNDVYNKLFSDLHVQSTAILQMPAVAAEPPAISEPETSPNIKAVKVGDSFSIAQIQELLLAGFILWKFPDGSTHQILVPKSPCLGQTLTEVGWTGIMPPEWKPIDTHPQIT